MTAVEKVLLDMEARIGVHRRRAFPVLALALIALPFAAGFGAFMVSGALGGIVEETGRPASPSSTRRCSRRFPRAAYSVRGS